MDQHDVDFVALGQRPGDRPLWGQKEVVDEVVTERLEDFVEDDLSVQEQAERARPSQADAPLAGRAGTEPGRHFHGGAVDLPVPKPHHPPGAAVLGAQQVAAVIQVANSEPRLPAIRAGDQASCHRSQAVLQVGADGMDDVDVVTERDAQPLERDTL